MLYEVADEALASSMARGCPGIDVGENIRLYRMSISSTTIPFQD